MSIKRKRQFRFATFAILPVLLALAALVPSFLAFSSRADASLTPTQWEKVRGYINSYYSGSQYSASLDGESGFRMGKIALWNRLDSNGNISPNAGASPAVGSAGTSVTGVLGEGDDMANRPVLVDNLSTQTAFIPGTEFRCNWNVDGSCFSDGSLTAIRQIVDAHKAAGFSTDIVDHCVSSQTAGPSTGGFGIIAQVPGALSSDTSLIPNVYIADYSRNGWRNSLSTASGAEAIAAPETSAGGYAAPTSTAGCDASATDYDLVRCQANWAISSTGGNVGNGQMTIATIAASGQSVDVRNGSITTMSSAGTNLQIPINTLFSTSGLANLDPLKTTVLAGRTQMGSTGAIGLRMLGYTTIAGGSISTGISRWNGTLGEAQVAYGDGLPLQNVAALPTTPASSTYAKVDTTGPSVSSVSSLNVTRNNADINRVAGEPATMKVEYGTTSGVYTDTVNNTVLNANKTVGLSSLSPNTTYYYKVTSYDGYANATESSEASFTTDPDITAPSVTNILPSGTIYTSTATISADYSDDVGGSGIDATATMVHLDGSNMLMDCPVQTTSHVECNATAGDLTVGVHPITVYVTDLAGNLTVGSGSVTVADNVGPVVGWTSPAQDSWTADNTPSITGTYSDAAPTSGIASASLSLDGTATFPYSCSFGAGIVTCNVTPALADGTYHGSISVADVAGNVTNSSPVVDFSVDTTGPVVSSNLPTGTSGNTSPTISASYTDGTGVGIDTSSVSVIVNGTPEVIGAGGCTVTASSVSCPKTGLTDNTYNVTVNVNDLLGNAGTLSWSFIINTAAPVIDSVVPGAGTWTTNLTPTVTINYHAAGTIDSATLSIDGTPCSGASWDQTHITCTAPTLTEATHTITGNISVGANITPVSSSFGVDRTGPVASNKTPSGWIQTASTIEADLTDAGSGIDGAASSVSLDGTPLAGCSWSNTHVSCPAPALTAGNHWTSYVVYDNVGINNGYGNSLGSFDVDTTAPSFSNILPSGFTTNVRPHITGNWSDGTGSGINLGTLEMTIDGTHPASGGCVIDASGFDCSLAVDLSEGPHVIGLGVYDNALNQGSGSGAFTIDTTAPVTTDNAPGGWQNHDVTVTLTCDDGTGSGCASTSWSGDNGLGSGSGTSVVVSNTGTTVISYHSTDALGTVETPDKTATVRIEKTNPAVTNLLPSGDVSTSLVPLSADLADSDSGINASSANIYVDGSPTALSGCTRSTSAISCEYTASPGSHTFTASVNDNAGNSGASVTPGSFYVNDFHTTGAIGAKYDSLGGASGFLGTPTTEEYDVAGIAGGRAQNFTGGRIYWSAGTGAHEIHGEILTDYLAVGPAILGLPTTDEIDVPGIAGGRKSELQYGTIYWSGVTGAHEVHGAIQGKWLAMGGPAVFGMPTSDEADVSGVTGGRWNMFQGGRIYWSAATGAHEIQGEILTKFLALGPAAFGLPTTDETGVPGYGPGRMSVLVGATIYWSGATGAYEVHGAIQGKWLAMGGPAVFGMPTSDEADVSGVTGGKWNQFQGGRVYWSAATGAHEIQGEILTKFLALGPAAFGLPTTDETGVPGYGPGRMSVLVGATIYWSGATGAHETHGGIRGKWLAMGGPAVFGMPTSDEQDVGGIIGGKWSQFQYANIYWSVATGPGAHEVHGAILAKYLEYFAGHTSFGLPTSDEYTSGSGRRSDFVSGYIYWDAAGGAVVTD